MATTETNTEVIEIPAKHAAQLTAYRKSLVRQEERRVWLQERYPQLWKQYQDAKAEAARLKIRWAAVEAGHSTLKKYLDDEKAMRSALKDSFDDPPVCIIDDEVVNNTVVAQIKGGGGALQKTTYCTTKFSIKK